MAHSRKLVLSGIALTQARSKARNSIGAMSEVRDDLEKEVIESGFLDAAPFTWIGISIRKGLVDDVEPVYDRIDLGDGELPVAIEIDNRPLLDGDKSQMINSYRRAMLVSLVHIGETYGLPTEKFKRLLNNMKVQ